MNSKTRWILIFLAMVWVFAGCGATEVETKKKNDTSGSDVGADVPVNDTTGDSTTNPDTTNIDTTQPDDGTPPPPDNDLDLISDEHEGGGTVDTDGDGMPDSMDIDADGDSILDINEAGDTDPKTPPVDSDQDGIPDFQDDDSDNNGIPDSVELDVDTDGDGIPDFRDDDNDGDGIYDTDEIAGAAGDCDGDGQQDPPGDASSPWDCDGNQVPDYMSVDSDGDSIPDRIEGYNTDTDGDGFYDRYDLDSDGDGLLDSTEAGDSNIDTPPADADGDSIPNYRDPDSDNDGLSDQRELENNTNPLSADTDNDSVSDLIEVEAGTNPLDAQDNPSANGDFFFLVPYEEPTDPSVDTLEFATSIQFADVYFGFDRTGSMDDEIAAIANQLPTIISQLQCIEYTTSCAIDSDCQVGQACGPNNLCIQDPLVGDGCIANLWTGWGHWDEIDTFQNRVSVQSNTNATANALQGFSNFSGGSEAPFQAPACVADGNQCTNSSRNCASSGVGCVGYRSEAIRVYIQVTDADDQCSGSRCGNFNAAHAGNLLSAQGIKFVGLYGSGDESGTGTAQSVAQDIAYASGTLNSSGQPLVYAANDSAVVQKTVDAVREIAQGVPLSVTVAAEDLPGDDGDALQFIDYLEVNIGGGNCTSVATVADTDGDGHNDAFPSLLPGSSVCWDVHPVIVNNTEISTTEPKIFRALVTVYGDGSPLDSREVFFLVPPDISGGVN